MVDPDQIDAIAEALSDLYGRWRQGRLASAVDPEFVQRFTRREGTRCLASVFDAALEQPASSEPIDARYGTPDAVADRSRTIKSCPSDVGSAPHVGKKAYRS